MAIFSAPRFVIFVAGPVIMNAEADPRLMPSASQLCKSGIVPPPQDCYIADDKFFEADINSYADVMEASKNIVRMCLENGASKRAGNLLGLFVEEMGKNIIKRIEVRLRIWLASFRC